MRQAGWQLVGVLLLTVCGGLVATISAQYPGFLIPEGGRTEKSPVTSPADAARRGKALFLSHCVRCHGPEGKGNGHAIQLRTQVDDMPAFQGKLTRDQVWDIVEHLKVLRTPVK